jgi:hypothetical protein
MFLKPDAHVGILLYRNRVMQQGDQTPRFFPDSPEFSLRLSDFFEGNSGRQFSPDSAKLLLFSRFREFLLT